MRQLFCSLLLSVLIWPSAIARLSQTETRPHTRATVWFVNGPDTRWELDETETEAFAELVATLKSRAPETEHDYLGFRGLNVILRDSVSGKSEEIRVYDGIVRRGEANRSVWFEDRERQVEQWLLETAKQKIGPGVYDGVRIQVESIRRHVSRITQELRRMKDDDLDSNHSHGPSR